VRLLYPLLYFVSYGAIIVLFASTIAVMLWLLVKLRRLAIRWLGGTIKD